MLWKCILLENINPLNWSLSQKISISNKLFIGYFFHVIIESDGSDSNYDFELSSRCLGHRYNLPLNLLSCTVFVILFKPQNENDIQNGGISVPNVECHSCFLGVLPFQWILDAFQMLFPSIPEMLNLLMTVLFNLINCYAETH